MGTKDKSKIDDLPETTPNHGGKYDDYEEPNVIFVGRVESKGETVSANPPRNIQDGRDKITLPEADEQIAGFHHPQAAQIIRAMPKAYKPVRSKGAK